MFRTGFIGLCLFGLVFAALSHPALSAGLADKAMTDTSAAKKKKYRQEIYLRKAPYAYARRGWADPSFGPDGRPYRNPYPPGTCTTDLGYGRFEPCDRGWRF